MHLLFLGCSGSTIKATNLYQKVVSIVELFCVANIRLKYLIPLGTINSGQITSADWETRELGNCHGPTQPQLTLNLSWSEYITRENILQKSEKSSGDVFHIHKTLPTENFAILISLNTKYTFQPPIQWSSSGCE